MTKCRDCGQPLSTKAHTCPHCGAPVDMTGKLDTRCSGNLAGCFMLVVLVLVAIIVLGFLTS